MRMVLLSILTVLFAAAPLTTFAADNQAGERKFAAILIWSTDEEKPEGKDLKELDPAIKEKFSKIPLKWKNYYEVTRKNVTVKPGEAQELKLSDKCLVKLHQSEKGLEVELIGEGKTVYKGNRSMPTKDMLVLGGDDKNETAWFVVLKPE
jgi:hypothetical protein